MTKLIYLCSPYSHPSEDIRHERFESAIYATGYLMNNEFHVYSPITSCHPVAMVCNLPREFSYWEEFDKRMITCCDELFILQIEGWNESVGMKAEFKFAREINKPVYLMIPSEDGEYRIILVIGDLWTT